MKKEVKTKWFVGIDPGKKGAIAAISEHGELQYWATPLIGNVMNLQSCLRIINEIECPTFALEDVHSLPGVSAKANFSFGENKGQWQGLLEGSQVQYMQIAPKAWQKIAWEGIPIIKKAKKESQKNASTDTKAMSLVAAQRLFPNETFLATSRSSVPHEGIVDGVLIAYALKCKLAGK